MTIEEPLPIGTLECPVDKERLHFRVLGRVLRLKRIDEHHGYVFDAYCPKCKQYLSVQATED